MSLFDVSQFKNNKEDPPRDRHIRALLARPTKLVVELLRRRHNIKLSKSIKKDSLQHKLNGFVQGGVLGSPDLAKMVLELRGWGHQQVYLFQFRGNDSVKRNWSKQWSDEKWALAHFEAANLSDIINKERNVEPNDSPELFKAEYSLETGKLRILWAERILTRVREEEEDHAPEPFELSDDGTSRERLVYLAFREIEEHDISSVELDFESGNLTFLIRKVSDRNYRETRDKLIADLKKLLDIDELFAPVQLRTLMENLYLVNNLNQRKKTYRSSHGRGTVAIASGSQDDLFADRVLQQVADSLEQNADATGVNLMWPIPARKPLGLYVYARYEGDQRIGIEAEALETGIRHVLQEVRRYSA